MLLVTLSEKVHFNCCVRTSDVLSDEQIGATFGETDSLPVIQRAYSLKAAKQPKDTSKVGVTHLANISVSHCLPEISI